MIPNCVRAHHPGDFWCADRRPTSAHRPNCPHFLALFGPSNASFFLRTDILLDKSSLVSHAFPMAPERGHRAIPIGGIGEHRLG